jgi:hypothetical protein
MERLSGRDDSKGCDVSLSAARRSLMFAQLDAESRRYDGVPAQLDTAEGFLAGLPDEEAAPVREEIAALRVAAAEAPGQAGWRRG